VSGLQTPFLISINDLSAEEIHRIFDLTQDLKERHEQGIQEQCLTGKVLGMIFDKASTRTRLSFSSAMFHLGGQIIYIQNQDIKLGLREAVKDTACVISRYLDSIMIRTSSHRVIQELADNSDVPVINGMSDEEHPCQALADFYTIKEKAGSLDGLKMAFVGDSNNVSRSLALLAAKIGVTLTIASPDDYSFDEKEKDRLSRAAKKSNGNIHFLSDPYEAVKDASVIYTDVWISMGQEEETADRLEIFKPYQINAELLTHATEDVMIMHCLPAHRGEEITDEVLDGPHSIVYDQAENRMHVQKSLLKLFIK